MKSAVVIVLALIISLTTFPVTDVSAATVLSPPHNISNGYTCASCHTLHKTLGSTGYNNICLSCHIPGDPKAGSKPYTQADMANPFGTFTSYRPAVAYQSSHNWASPDTNLAAGAEPPIQAAMTTNNLRARTGGKMACVRCHNQHSQTFPPFLRVANDRDQLCLDCHRSRDRRDHTTGTHPINFTYTSATSKIKTKPFEYYSIPRNANPGNPTSALPLKGGLLLCSTCHGVHYSDSNSATFDTFSSFTNQTPSAGFLLHTDLHGVTADAINICSSCHRAKLAHNKRGQNVQCTDCHGGHVDPGDGSQPNVWLLNRLINFSSAIRSARNRPVLFQSATVKNYKDANGTGVCQACHDIPLTSGFQTFHGSADSSTCNNCHTHASALGSFAANLDVACNFCHGYPPIANVAGPGGYANGYQIAASFTDESQSGHTTHASTPYQKACENCHTGNNHIDGNFQDVFLVTAGTVAATGGLTPAYDRLAQVCSSVYCHSNAGPRGGTAITTSTPSWNKAKGGGIGAIVGQPNECGFCHSRAGDVAPTWSLSHTRHVNGYSANANFTCTICHAKTAISNSAIFNTTTARASHTNGVKDVVFNSFAAGGSWNNATAACTNLYCHSSVQGSNGLGQPTAFTANLIWNGPAMTCVSCHAGMVKLVNVTSATGSHKTHLQIYPYDCSLCHGAGYTSSSVTIATHVNNVIDIAFTSTAITKGATPSYNQGSNPPEGGYAYCTNVYCHSTVQDGNGNWPPTTFSSPVWGSGPLICGSCHANMATSAAASGSHVQHAQTAKLICPTCHNGAGKDPNPPHTATPLHADGVIELSFTGTAANTIYSLGNQIVAGSGYGTCATTTCHGSSSPTWGGNTARPDCEKCHGSVATNPFFTTDGSTAKIDPKAGAHTAHLQATTPGAGHQLSSNIGCAECHTVPTSLTAAGHFDTTGSAEVSFGTLAKTSALIPAYNSPAAGQCANVYCHGKSLTSNASPPASVNLAPTWNVPLLTGIPGTAGNGSTTPGTGDCSKCHAYPPMTATHAGKLATQCVGCHTHVNTSGTGFTDPSKHINGAIEVTVSGHAYPYPGATHMSAVGATTPLSNCNCHDSTNVGTYPVTRGTPPNCRACHVTGLLRTVATSSCYDCHGLTATDGQPKGNTFPNISGSHSKHTVIAAMTCTNCHFGYGTGSTRHGFSNTSTSTKGKVAFNGLSPTPTWTAATYTCTNTCHGTAVWGSKLGCINCHASSITRTQGRPGTTLAAVKNEFGLPWGHKPSGKTPARASVSDADCIACHLEGNFTTQKTSAFHGDGNIDLRDPDGAGETPITNISGAAFTFQRFSTSYAAGSRTATGHTANTIDNVITQKFCLACHDSNGATNTTARSNNGGPGTAAMPFGGITLGANYIAANNAIGPQGLIDVKTQLLTTNKSWHPVLGPKNRDFPTAARMNVPYKPTGTRGAAGTLSQGVVLNCFDCHNVAGSPLTRRTVAAHGNAVTIRGTATVSGTPSAGNAVTLCAVCHASYQTGNNHGSGSAFTSGTDGGMTAYVSFGCNICHSSGYTIAVPRPIRGQDTHGSNTLGTVGTLLPTTGRWSTDPTPYAFIRNRQVLPQHQPKRVGSTTFTNPNCMGGSAGPCSQGSENYSPGGTF